MRLPLLPVLFVLTVWAPVARAAGPPPAMEAFHTENFVFTFPPGASGPMRGLAAGAEALRRRLCDDLGVPCFGGPVRVHLATSPQEWIDAQPDGGDGHVDWASGIAHTRRAMIILRSDRGGLLDLADTFAHEVSHMALKHGVGHRFLPRWFVEGVAIHQAGEEVVERVRSVSQAALTRSLIPIDDLAFSFPDSGGGVHLAYAESVLFLRWLLAERSDGHVAVIARVAAGEKFRDVFPEIFGDRPSALWESWRDSIRERASWLSLVTDSGIFWVLATLIFILAYWRRRKQFRARLAQMEEEERERARPGEWLH